MWDPYGKWSSIEGCFPWMRFFPDVKVQSYGPGYRKVACGPSLCIKQKTSVGWKSYLLEKRHEPCKQEVAGIVKEKSVVRSSAVPCVVVSAPDSDDVHLVDGTRGSVVGRSVSMEVSPPSVDHTSKDVSASSVDVVCSVLRPW